jgi:molybdate transport system substrate-binding protein
LKGALLNADALVFNNVASGNYFASVLERLGISEAVRGKVTRANPADVVTRIVQGKGTEIGVNVIPSIRLDKRLTLVGSLPDELQSYLVYAAAITTSTPSSDAGKDFIRFLASPPGRAAFSLNGAD